MTATATPVTLTREGFLKAVRASNVLTESQFVKAVAALGDRGRTPRSAAERLVKAEFLTRFQAERKAMPTKTQAAVYTSCLHFLRSMQAAGTRDALAVNRAIRSMPVDRFGQQATVRADGRVLYNLGLYRVKDPAASRGEWDLYEQVGSIPASEAFLPMVPGCETAS